MDAQLRVNWPKRLAQLVREWHPAHAEFLEKFGLSYYWSVREREWATDLVFRDPARLRRLYPRLLHHSLISFGSREVLRFLGRTVPRTGVPKRFQGEVLSDLQERQEGLRLKHQVNQNSVKIYDKAYTPQGSVVRVEVTLNHAEEFWVYRRKEGDPKGRKQWRVLRRVDWRTSTAELRSASKLMSVIWRLWRKGTTTPPCKNSPNAWSNLGAGTVNGCEPCVLSVLRIKLGCQRSAAGSSSLTVFVTRICKSCFGVSRLLICRSGVDARLRSAADCACCGLTGSSEK